MGGLDLNAAFFFFAFWEEIVIQNYFFKCSSCKCVIPVSPNDTQIHVLLYLIVSHLGFFLYIPLVTWCPSWLTFFFFALLPFFHDVQPVLRGEYTHFIALLQCSSYFVLGVFSFILLCLQWFERNEGECFVHWFGCPSHQVLSRQFWLLCLTFFSHLFTFSQML